MAVHTLALPYLENGAATGAVDLYQADRRRGDSPGRQRQKNDLPLLLNEIISSMAARDAMLSLHPNDHGTASILAMSPALRGDGKGQAVLDLATAFNMQVTGSTLSWGEGVAGLGSTAMRIPFEPAAGQGRLVLTLFFSPLTTDAVELAERVYGEREPFITAYFRLWQSERALRTRLGATEAAFNQLDTGFLLLNRVGDILFANAAAQTILETGDGLRRMRSSIGATHIADSVTLQVALNHVIVANADPDTDAAPPIPMVTLTRKSGPPLVALLLATPIKAVGPEDAAIAMYINDPALDTAAMLAPVCRLYRLSPVEAKLVTHLAQGLPLAEAAKYMNIRELTARTYMKQIFIKTDTNRQTELVVLMLSSLVRMHPALLKVALPLLT